MYWSMYWHTLVLGLFLGWGAAIPFGPINFEMLRRNLSYGARYAIAMGLGACTADLTYLLLLTGGVLHLLNYPVILRIVSILGAVVLAWFGIMAFTKSSANQTIEKHFVKVWRNTLDGYLLTLLNPYTIIFWASVSSQLSVVGKAGDMAIIYAGIGVILGTVSWVLVLNTVVHHTRHRLSDKTMAVLNKFGGVILLGFAAYGLWHGIFGNFN